MPPSRQPSRPHNKLFEQFKTFLEKLEKTMLKRFTLLACAFTVLLTSGISAKAAVAGDDDAAPGTLTISIRDLCDPLTFNATAPAGLGPGSCIRDDNPVVNGSQTLAGFRFELGQEKSAG